MLKEPKTENINMTKAVVIKNLKKIYRDGTKALNGINLEVDQGEFFGLLGPNGAGKSTILSIMTSLVLKSSGHVEIFGYNIDTDFSQAKLCQGVVPQEFNFNQFEKVYNICVTQAGYYGIPRHIAKQRTEKYLKKLELWGKRDAQAMMLSGGMKRRLMIARALVHKPKLLILDEPTAGVDIELRRSMWEFLNEINASGTTIIMTTHYLEEAESLCRKIAIIDKGNIVKDSNTQDLLRQLNAETFIMDVESPLTEAPKLHQFATKLITNNSFEVVVAKGQPLNLLFQLLSAQNINIVSMKNKANRLEELFISLVNH